MLCFVLFNYYFSGGVTARAKGRYIVWEMSGVGAHDVKVPKNQ